MGKYTALSVSVPAVDRPVHDLLELWDLLRRRVVELVPVVYQCSFPHYPLQTRMEHDLDNGHNPMGPCQTQCRCNQAFILAGERAPQV